MFPQKVAINSPRSSKTLTTCWPQTGVEVIVGLRVGVPVLVIVQVGVGVRLIVAVLVAVAVKVHVAVNVKVEEGTGV